MMDIDLDHRVFSAFKARYNAVKRHATSIISTATMPAKEVDGLLLADMRDDVEELTKAFHEANAYHNALLAIRQSKKDQTND